MEQAVQLADYLILSWAVVNDLPSGGGWVWFLRAVYVPLELQMSLQSSNGFWSLNFEESHSSADCRHL
jgi:hypothetical protein